MLTLQLKNIHVVLYLTYTVFVSETQHKVIVFQNDLDQYKVDFVISSGAIETEHT